MERLDGKIAVVTGAGRGIGRAVADLLAESGATVILVARTASEVEAAAAEIRRMGGSARAAAGDLTRREFVEELFGTVARDHGRIDILVNNAGIAPFGSVETLDPERFRMCLELNVVAPFRCTQQAVRLMKAKGNAGKIINVGSVRSHWSEAGDAGAYNASKFALRAMTESIARELQGGGSNIAVGMVCPGVVDTTLTNPRGEPRPAWLTARQVAEAIVHALSAPDGVNYYDTVLFSTSQKPW